ncbi:helicase-associated domain-containing protein [Streptomyces sp. NBC_01808]|uniref:helicase-associated domain-containing protein n=1 Tax=Streptomyces sp. NBC_01808 TaxID=2975947 RepID=UPI002DD9F269|nr:helicase-associated domain-containing protein [Streptomyces sp. NBC_01808]WSA38521.1 helicase-associated domain-containing protein [Streptomyces sp. NBC_01808]
MTTGNPARTLAEELRGRPDTALAGLLRARPDLLTPVPGDLTQLATRAGTRASVVRALERLDRFTQQTAQALAIAPDPCPYDVLAGLMGDEPDTVAALPRAVAELRAQALVWGDERRLRLVRTARELLTPQASGSATGLGPAAAEVATGMSPGRLQQVLANAGLPATHDPVSAAESLTALFSDPKRMADLLDEAPPEAVTVLGRLTWGPPYGTVSAQPPAHVRWLLDRGLLLPTAPGSVLLPREVALHLRDGRAHRSVAAVPPEPVAAGTYGMRVVDATAAGQAAVAVETVEELLGQWATASPPVLRAGGLAVRDLKRTATALDVAEPQAAFWVELAYGAGLLASDGETDERYAPTPAYDEWLALPAAERWAELAAAWLAATRTPGLVGGRDGKGRALSALGEGLDRGAAPEVRRAALGLLAGLPEGTAATPDSVVDRLRWERPPRGGPAAEGEEEDLRTRLARWTLEEAELLGVTGRGALATHGRALLSPPEETAGPPEAPPEADEGPPPATPEADTADAATPLLPRTRPRVGRPSDNHPAPPPATGTDAPEHPAPATPAEARAAALRAAGALAPHLPPPVDHVLLQADLTAIAPGPLKRELAAVLGVLAEVESKGGATVYRFTQSSVRRALDAGRSAAELHDFLTAHSRTPVPQPLSYLIDDVARKHGRLRIGAAGAYLRCDDDALLAEIVADRRSAELRLRHLAPTVLVSPTPPDVLLARLRAMGYAPAAESPDGAVLVARAAAHRTPPRTPPAPVPDGPPAPDTALLTAAVRAVRAGDRAATAPLRTPQTPQDPRAQETPRAPSTPQAPGGLPRTPSAETLAVLQAAVLGNAAVWIGYVNADGAASQRVIAPVRVEGGYVTAYDHTADEVRTYPLHRITGAAELADDPT